MCLGRVVYIENGYGHGICRTAVFRSIMYHESEICIVRAALVDFRNTPLDQPVTRGLYRISRHPQIVMSSVVLLGSCIAIGSWLALLALLAARVFSHLGILAEEEVCLRKYGDEYRAYMERVPRYFVLF